MINTIKTMWFNYQKKNRKIRMQSDIEQVELTLHANDQWKSDISTLISILEAIDDKVLEEADFKTTSKFICLTGFNNSRHLLDWLSVVRSNIHNGILLGEETRVIPYLRKNRSLKDFIISDNKVSTTVAGFKQQLLHGLKELSIEVETISDSRTKHRERSIINSAVRDIFAVVEIIIAWGVSDE